MTKLKEALAGICKPKEGGYYPVIYGAAQKLDELTPLLEELVKAREKFPEYIPYDGELRAYFTPMSSTTNMRDPDAEARGFLEFVTKTVDTVPKIKGIIGDNND